MKGFDKNNILSRKYFAPLFHKKENRSDADFLRELLKVLKTADPLDTGNLGLLFFVRQKLVVVAAALDSFQNDILNHAGKIEKILNRTAKKLIDNQGDAKELKKLYDRAKDLNQKYLAISDFVGDLQTIIYGLKEDADKMLERNFRLAFACKLKKARIDKKMTQQQVSDAADVPKSDISQFENGRKLPSLLTLAKITTAIGISFNDLFNIK